MTGASWVRPDGTAELSEPDLMTVLGALSDAVQYRLNNPGPADWALIALYKAVAMRLGDDR